MYTIAVAAYSVYVPRLPEGVRPAPMDANYQSVVQRGQSWVAEIEGKIAGFVVLVQNADHVLLENIAVHPDYQGRGVGRRLFAFVDGRAHSNGTRIIRLYTNAVMVENQELYKRLGYIETDRRQEGPLDRVYYEKRV